MRFRSSQFDSLAAFLRPPLDLEDFKTGWQHEASSRIEQTLFRVIAEPERAMLRSQGGSGAGAALQTCSTCPPTRIDPALFRVLLLRRLPASADGAFHSIPVVTTELVKMAGEVGCRWCPETRAFLSQGEGPARASHSASEGGAGLGDRGGLSSAAAKAFARVVVGIARSGGL